MRAQSVVVAAGCVLLSCQGSQAGPPSIGLNLSETRYYTQEVPFINVLKQSQEMFAQRDGASWGQSDPGGVVFGDDGYPTFLAGNHSARALWDAPKGYPGGQHVLLWDGVGSVSLQLSPDQILSWTPGRIAVNMPAGESRRLVQIDSSNSSDPVRNIRFVPIAHEAAFTNGEPANPFRDVFLDRWDRFDSFRYMDWGETNNSNVSSWSDRTEPMDQTQGSDDGVALEYQIAHANQTGANPWFNIPHLADDNYIREAAELIRDNLAPGLVARIEYSNEVWNGQFDQAGYATQQGAFLPGSPGGFQGSLWWYSKRSVEMFDIFTDVFTEGGTNPGGADRLVRVLATQAANSWTGQQVLEYEDAYLKADALAIAPYFGAVINAGSQATQWKNASWTQRFQFVEAELQNVFGWMQSYRNLLDSSSNYDHIELFGYEGGQHFLGASNTHGDTELTELFWELNRRPEMRDLYRRYLEHWESIGGSDFMIFSSLDEFSRTGSWGHLEYEGQPLSEAPKLQGIFDYLDSVAAQSGDFDGDGDTDITDLMHWQRGESPNSGNADDLAAWEGAFGNGSASSTAAATYVPEPTSGAAAILLALAALARRRQPQR